MGDNGTLKNLKTFSDVNLNELNNVAMLCNIKRQKHYHFSGTNETEYNLILHYKHYSVSEYIEYVKSEEYIHVIGIQQAMSFLSYIDAMIEINEFIQNNIFDQMIEITLK